MHTPDLLATKMKLLYIFQCAALACFTPFLTFNFQQKGFSYTQIGILLAVCSVVGIFAQPIWGIVSDKYLNKRTSLIIAMFISAILIYILIFMLFKLISLFSVICLILAFKLKEVNKLIGV